jgi:protease I
MLPSKTPTPQCMTLLLPGGVMNPDKLRHNSNVLQFVRSFANSKEPIAAICHAPWTLIDAGVVKGRRLTSYESLRTDLKNADQPQAR